MYNSHYRLIMAAEESKSTFPARPHPTQIEAADVDLTCGVGYSMGWCDRLVDSDYFIFVHLLSAPCACYWKQTNVLQ